VQKGRSKKGKKAAWHLRLKLKDLVFAGIGVVGLMMMSFALGVLSGRGDIYRAASRWGIMSPEAARVGQWSPTPLPPPAALPSATTAAAPATSTSAKTAPPGRPPKVAAVPKGKASAPVVGSITPLPPPAAARKKPKAHPTSRHKAKSRQEELQRVRKAVVSKLKFQNSFDTGLKPRPPKSKSHHKKSHSTQVRVGQYKTSKAAAAKVAELQKKGLKATTKKTKDARGTWFTVYKTTPSPQAPSEKLARKSKKSSGLAHKPKAD
jgi:hypothetical protein